MANTIKSNPEAEAGLYTCSRYAYPPNSLSLCGPESQKANLNHYSTTAEIDGGTGGILVQFSTLYPYLKLIALENGIRDPFDERVVEAYWLGNTLLNRVSKSSFARHLTDGMELRKKIKKGELENIFRKFKYTSYPNHSFHVLNIYKRTGNLDVPHTLQTMDACLVNFGTVAEILKDKIRIKTQKLAICGDSLKWEKNIERYIRSQGSGDYETKSLKPGDHVSYHWGILCRKISPGQAANLNFYNGLSVKLANIHR